MQWEAPSKPLAVDNPLLLSEQEVRRNRHTLVFRLRNSERRVCQNPSSHLHGFELHSSSIKGTKLLFYVIKATINQGLTTCMEPRRGWTIACRSWIFLRKRWLDREQELITVFQEETKRTEDKEEAGYRSPTWSILRALQKINKAKRLEGEAVMSAPPFFQSAGRGDLKFWGEDDGPTVVV